MKIIITGGYGYIGSNIAERLIKSGHKVIIIDYINRPSNLNYLDCESIKCDITNFDDLSKNKLENVDAVLHLAAQSSGPASIKIPEKDINLNIIGTLNIIKWCKLIEAGKIVFASSFVVYGDNTLNEQVNEIDHCYPKSIYALSKHYCERLFDTYANSLELKWNILRMFNVYGPGQDLDRSDQGMVSIFLKKVIDSNYVGVKGSLDRFRDFIHIDDVVQGWELCLNDNKNYNEIYNLGSGVKTKLSQLIDSIIKVCDKEGQVEVEETGTTPGDIMGIYSNIDKISSQLNYIPKLNLINGLENFSEWAKVKLNK